MMVQSALDSVDLKLSDLQRDKIAKRLEGGAVATGIKR
jgi:hypothetical protein